MQTQTLAIVPDIPPPDSPTPQAWWRYATEVLDHVRLPYRTASALDAQALSDDTGLVLITHHAGLDAATRERLAAWVNDGGAVVVVGDPGDLAELAGSTNVTSLDAEHGHVDVHADAVWTHVPDVALHAVGGVRLNAGDDVDVLASWEDGGAAVTARRVGSGVVIACGVDLWQTIVRIQQGYPVAADGVPASDGSAPIDEGILKCEDGMALCLERDRALPPGEPELDRYEHVNPPVSGLPMFHRPHADLWRSLFLQCVWWAAEQVELAQPWLYYWPAGVSAVAHMSHDADLGVDEQGRAALEAFDEADVKVTWCQVFPGGYEPETFAAVGKAGHEQALHYNAMHDADIATWGWPQIRAQYAWAQAVTGVDDIVSNKNHYTRWEGFTEFYEWCERLGIQIDQSRGPSKQGTVGFPFGTAHVSFPIADADDGHRFYDVLNLPLHTQDLAWAGHESIRDVILDNAIEQHGVAHFLFHGPHLLMRPPTRKACLALADEARRRGLPWWTSKQINEWERLRRRVQVTVRATDGGWLVESSAEQPVPDAAIMLMLPGVDRAPAVVSGTGSVATVQRHGRTFIELTADVPAGSGSWKLAPHGS